MYLSGGGGRHHYDRLALHPFAQLKQFGIAEKDEPISFPKTVFGNDVWIGMGATIIAGASVGNGAVIGAGSLVTKDVPPYAIAFGVPAKVHKMRFDDTTIETLLKIEWWNWPDDILAKNIDLFSRTLEKPDLKRLLAIYEELHL